jgi:hypothetical protein
MKRLIAVFALAAGCALAQSLPMEALPDRYLARLEVRDRILRNLPPSFRGFSFVVDTLKRWQPGSTVRVAFLDGSNPLRKGIADAASAWLAHGNIRLDFGYDPAAGTYRSWSRGDQTYQADIRISFDGKGYYSLVGRDSNDPAVVHPSEESMNFEGFLANPPPDWQATAMHEFGHAFGFQHEHQHPVGGCDSEFRWFDDPGYSPEPGRLGLPDSQGRRPGIYTALAAPPNEWPASKVDRNLKQLPNSSAFLLGAFDRASIMMYSFAAWMFVSSDSRCYTPRNKVLSEGDRQGFAQAYPAAAAEIISLSRARRDYLDSALREASLPADRQRRLREQLREIR